MQQGYLPPEVVQVKIVMDDVICARKALCARGLGRHDFANCVFIRRVSRTGARKLDIFWNVHDQNPVHAGLPASLEEQRDADDAIGRIYQTCALLDRFSHQWMEYRLQTAFPPRLREDDAPQHIATQFAQIIDDIPAEFANHLTMGRSPRFDEFAGNDIRVDNRNSQVRKQIGYRGLATADPTGKADLQGWRQGVQAHRMYKVFRSRPRISASHPAAARYGPKGKGRLMA